jgi:fructose-specific phosphotransferase system IIC component
MPQTNLGTFYKNITETGFNVPNMAMHLIDPYTWNGTPVSVIFMLLFSPVFIGVWLRSRTVLIALILGFVTGSFILYSNQGLRLGLPPEVIGISQAICYVAFAGLVVYVIKR